MQNTNYNRIIVIEKERLENIPPVLSLLIILSNSNKNICFICSSIPPNLESQLRNLGIIIFNFNENISTNKLTTLITYISFRKKTKQLLNNLSLNNNDLIWVASSITILAIGDILIKLKQKFILHIFEIHTSLKEYAISRYIKYASVVVMSEYNRSFFYRIKYKLLRTPTVFFNKPYFLPSLEHIIELEKKYSKHLSILKNKKIILYQGMISKDRDLSPFVEALSKNNKDYTLLLIGKDIDNLVDNYKCIYKNVYHIPFIPAPDYLVFTKIAHIGLVTYNPYKLNTAYCAPNKTFEYGAYSVPFIGNNIPGLKNIIEKYDCGVIFEDESIESINNAISHIECRLDNFKNNVFNYYKSSDNIKIVDNIINMNYL